MPYQRFKLNSGNDSGNSDSTRLTAELLYITQSYYDHDWPSVMHTHNFTELFYVLNGKGYFTIEDNSFSVKEDDLIIINPNVAHTERCTGSDSMEYIVIGLNGLQFCDKDKTRYDYSFHNYSDHKHEVVFILKTMLQEAHKKESNFQGICKNLLEILLLYLQRTANATVSSYSASKKTSREYRFIEQYIDNHFSEDISLETLSSLTYMNKYYLVHAFKNYKGISPINYLITKRIQEAKVLLETTNFSIAKIAQHVGFSSQSYFSQTFRKETQMTPIQYKKQYERLSASAEGK